MHFKPGYIIILIATVMALGTSCKKTKTLTNGGRITFSVDTLMFDTVFTAAGSFTTSFKIFNPQNEDIVISSVHLQNGASSYFHLNVDGFQGNTQTNLKVRAHDSIYVFATVNIDPTNAATPFIVTDDFIATMNGQDYNVPFTAFGQNAHYIIDSVLEGTPIPWGTQDKLPYVILHNAEVDSAATLTIAAGTRIYVNQDSRLFVLGKLKILGTPTDSVVIQGDRLDRSYYGYEGYPGEWGGLYFDGRSSGDTMAYTILKNCGGSTNLGTSVFSPAAIQLNVPTANSTTTQLAMDHCIVENSIGYGILSFGGSLNMYNCRINTCGAQALALLQGGTYSINNCTFACFATNNVAHTDNGTVAILNYYAIDNTHYQSGDLNGVMRNCIIWGGLSTEFACDSLPGGVFNFYMQNCLYRADSIEHFAQPKLFNCIANMDPMFKNTGNFDFHIPTTSPAAVAGAPIVYAPYNTDLDGVQWVTTPNLGCYKAQ